MRFRLLLLQIGLSFLLAEAADDTLVHDWAMRPLSKSRTSSSQHDFDHSRDDGINEKDSETTHGTNKDDDADTAFQPFARSLLSMPLSSSSHVASQSVKNTRNSGKQQQQQQQEEEDKKARSLQQQGGIIKVSCEDQNATVFEFETYIQLVGRLANITQNELDLLGQAFVTTYNSLVPSCPEDTSRTLLNATLFVDNSVSNPPSNLTGLLTLPFVLRMRTSLLCKGCSENSTLFSNNGTSPVLRSRMLEFDVFTGNEPLDSFPKYSEDDLDRQLQQANASSLPSSPPSDRPSFSPSSLPTAPSPTPSSIPTVSTKPTTSYVPTKSPSSSHGPSVLPTDSPTELPSALPSTNPSTAPTSPIIILLPCPDCPGPSDVDFVERFDTVVRELALNGTLRAVDSVSFTPVVELEPVNCTREERIFRSDVFVDFFGNQSAATPAELQALQQGFLETYNLLNTFRPGTCDLFFREIINVEIVNTDALFNRRLEEQEVYYDSFGPMRMLTGDENQCENETNTTNSSNSTDADTTNSTDCVKPVNDTTARSGGLRIFAYQFKITGRCLGCKRDDDLFDDSSGSRPKDLGIVFDGRRFLQSDNDSPLDPCVCAVDPDESQEIRAPSREEFATAFNDTVTTLIEDEVVQSIEEVVEVVEVDPVSCPVEVSSFTSDIFLTFFGSPENLNALERRALEGTFAEEYNDLVEQFCDPLFRTVREVSIVDVQDVNGNTLNLTNRTSGAEQIDFVLLYQARGRCRGCPENSNLFDDGTVQRLLLENGHRGRRIEQEETCYCDTESITLERTPSEDEFEDLYRKRVRSLFLSSIGVVRSVIEPNPTSVPSTAPSGPPSVFDQERFDDFFSFPYTFHAQVTSNSDVSPPDFPIYQMSSPLPPVVGGMYTGTSTIGNAAVSFKLEDILVPWNNLKAVGVATNEEVDQFILNVQARSDVIKGTMTGHPQQEVAFFGLVVSYTLGSQTSVEVLPLADSSDQTFADLSSTRRFLERYLMTSSNKLESRTNGHDLHADAPSSGEVRASVVGQSHMQQEEENVLVSHHRWLQAISNSSSGGCSYLNDAIRSISCATDGKDVVTDEQCLNQTEAMYSEALDGINADREVIQFNATVELRDIILVRLTSTSYGYFQCLQLSQRGDTVFSECLLREIGDALRQEVNSRSALESRVSAEEEALDVRFSDLCSQSESKASQCFTCVGCSTSQPHINCCSDSDCSVGFACNNFICIEDSSLRVVLTWVGVNGLDLHVVTPGGFDISSTNPNDPTTGGHLVSSSSSGNFGYNSQTILFPLVADLGGEGQVRRLQLGDGNITYYVEETIEGANIPWDIALNQDGVEVSAISGTGESGPLPSFTFVVRSESPSWSPSLSLVPTLAPSDVPSTSRAPTTSGIPSSSVNPSSNPSDIPSISVVPSSSPSASPSDLASASPSDLPSASPSDLPSVTHSITPSLSSKPSGPTMAPSRTSSPTFLPSTVPTDSPKPSPSPSGNPTATLGPSLSSDPPTTLPTVSNEPSLSQLPSISNIPTRVPSISFSPSASVIPSNLPSVTNAPSKVASESPSVPPSKPPSESSAPSAKPSVSPTESQKPSESKSPSVSISPSRALSVTPTESPRPSPSPSTGPTTTMSPTIPQPSFDSYPPSSLPTDSRQPSLSNYPSASDIPSTFPSGSNAPSVSNFPSVSPTVSIEPSVSPTTPPSASPSISPILSPSSSPSVSVSPTAAILPSESSLPSTNPTTSPTPEPTRTFKPSFSPSVEPTDSPFPTPSPSGEPSATTEPSRKIPTISSLPSLSNYPSASDIPSSIPSGSSAPSVSDFPSVSPTVTSEPSTAPTASPSVAPSVPQTLSPPPSISDSPSGVPTGSPTGEQSQSNPPSASPSKSVQPSAAAPTESPKPSPSPSNSPTSTKAPSNTSRPTSSPLAVAATPGPTQSSDPPTTIPTVSNEPSLSQIPSISNPPSLTPSGSKFPSITQFPSIVPSVTTSPSVTSFPTKNPNGGPHSNPPSVTVSPSFSPSATSRPSTRPTVSPNPSSMPSNVPSVSKAPTPTSGTPPPTQSSDLPTTIPTVSNEPSLSQIPSISNPPSRVPSGSKFPSVSQVPSTTPTLTNVPSISNFPTKSPEGVPSRSPSVTARPSVPPTGSLHPSFSPSREPSISKAPTPTAGTALPTQSSDPPTTIPTVSNEPSRSQIPSISNSPSGSPSVTSNSLSIPQLPSNSPTISIEPSATMSPSDSPV